MIKEHGIVSAKYKAVFRIKIKRWPKNPGLSTELWHWEHILDPLRPQFHAPSLCDTMPIPRVWKYCKKKNKWHSTQRISRVGNTESTAAICIAYFSHVVNIKAKLYFIWSVSEHYITKSGKHQPDVELVHVILFLIWDRQWRFYPRQWIPWLLKPWWYKEPGPWFNIKIMSYQYRKSHCGDKTIVRLGFPKPVKWHLYIESGPWATATRRDYTCI